MGYRHFEVETVQSPKHPGSPCGDAVACERSASGTTVVVSDGLGSGVKANIAATMCVSRMLEYARREVSLRQGFSNLVQTMNRARGTDLPYAVFTVIRILPDGAATVLSYEMPPVVLVGLHTASPLPRRTFTLGSDVIGESHCHLEPGEGILAYSDGVTQAGMGLGLTWGWTEEGVARFVSDRLARSAKLRDIPRAVHNEARTLWGRAAGDDVAGHDRDLRVGGAQLVDEADEGLGVAVGDVDADVLDRAVGTVHDALELLEVGRGDAHRVEGV